MAIKKPAIGRGLGALIEMEGLTTKGSLSFDEIALSLIEAHADQPRRDFDSEALEELAASIREVGIIQPITVRQTAQGNYQIIAGERRYRAAKLAGLTAIPAYIKKATDESVMEMALIENIQREDLNSIEVALAYQKLIEQSALTQEQLSERVGKKRATVTNYLRLLKLPAEIQIGIKDRRIEMGHARAIAGLTEPHQQLDLYEDIIKYGYSVRQVELWVKEHNGLPVDQQKQKDPATKSVSVKSGLYRTLEQQLSHFLSTSVRVSANAKGKGAIQIGFKDEQEFERILELLDNIKK